MRRRFQELEEWTGWRTLPQVFVHDTIVGGLEEALTHPRLRGPLTLVAITSLLVGATSLP